MSEAASPDPELQEIPVPENDRAASLESSLKLSSSTSHQILTLVGFAFLCFEVLFLDLYFDNSWFSVDLSIYGVPVILCAVFAAHFILLFGESQRACRWFSWIHKGRPPVVYRKWVELNPDGIVFGIKHIRYQAIDELELSWFGNLVIKSRLVCGKDALNPDILLKLPFAAASFDTQENLLAAIKQHRPDLVLNKRLSVGRNPALQKGSQITQLATALIMTLLLLDVGFSSFYYLELLKNYYLSEESLLNNAPKEGQTYFDKAEYMRLHPLAFSWVSSKFLKSSTVAAGIWEQRSRVLWLQGKHDQAIADSRKSVEEAPTNLRHRLYLTRLLVEENKRKDAREQLEQIIKDHKHSLMPRLYILANIKESEKEEKLKLEYKNQLDTCYEEVYENEPHWPPGGNRFFTELFYSDDLRFLMDRFLNAKYSPNRDANQH